MTELYSDWYFSYDEILQRGEQSEKIQGYPSREELHQRIHEFYRKKILLNPNDVDLFGTYSSFCTKCGDFTPAENLVTEIAENCSFLPDLYCYLAISMESLRQPATAIKYLEKAVNVEIEEKLKGWAYYRMGWHQFSYSQDDKAAKKWLQKSIASDPEYDSSYLLMVRILSKEDF